MHAAALPSAGLAWNPTLSLCQQGGHWAKVLTPGAPSWGHRWKVGRGPRKDEMLPDAWKASRRKNL